MNNLAVHMYESEGTHRSPEEIRANLPVSQKIPSLPLPVGFPLSFEKMLKRLMPSVKAADRYPRFKAWLQSRYGGALTKNGAEKQIAVYKAQPIGRNHYRLIAWSFGAWWAEELSRKRSAAGARKRGKCSKSLDIC